MIQTIVSNARVPEYGQATISFPIREEDYGGARMTELDVSQFTDPDTKNAEDLVAYVTQAWESGWGYVWGTFGQTLTESLFESKLQQYPEGVGNYEDFIRANWLGGRTADCVGLIKSYGWLDADALTIRYGTNGMPDIGADAMYRNATVKGGIDTIPEVPGLAVWHSGHIGVYIGNGQVIEAMGTKYGVVKTQLSQRSWTAWLEIPYIWWSFPLIPEKDTSQSRASGSSSRYLPDEFTGKNSSASMRSRRCGGISLERKRPTPWWNPSGRWPAAPSRTSGWRI